MNNSNLHIGRAVYYNNGTEAVPAMWAAIVSFVHSNGSVNLMVIDHVGNPYPKASVIEGKGHGQWNWGVW